MKKVTRQHTAQYLTLTAYYHATSSQDAMDWGKEQPPALLDPFGRRILHAVADATCWDAGSLVFCGPAIFTLFFSCMALRLINFRCAKVSGWYPLRCASQKGEEKK